MGQEERKGHGHMRERERERERGREREKENKPGEKQGMEKVMRVPKREKVY